MVLRFLRIISVFLTVCFHINRGVGTGETSEARASPEIRGYLKSNSQIGKKKNMPAILFLGASPETTQFLRP